MTVDMKSPGGQAVVRRLIADSDVVANNFTPGTMEKFGLGYDAVRDIREDIVYLAMSMHGPAGPEARYLGYGLTMGAVTGLQYLCGLPDEEPAGTGTNYPDHVPNPCHAAFAVLAALRHRRRTGQGQCIDVAQIEPTIALLGPAVLDFTANGRVVERAGNQHVAAAPHGVYPCLGEDRWIAISAQDHAAWMALLAVLGTPGLATDPRFVDAVARWRHRTELDQALAAITATLDARDLMTRLQAAGVPAGAVQDAADVLLHDPQLRHREHWVYLEHGEMGRTVYNALPFRLSRTPGYPHRPAPLLGEHTDQVLAESLGMEADAIAALRAEGALT
jgi:benzylsuccinate CoA-transferase BbsF subunit